jgi:aminopeptidase N
MRIFFSFLFLISSVAFAQQTQKVDFISANGTLSIDPTEKRVSGKVSYDFEVQSAIDTITIDAQQMEFSAVKINNKEVRFKNSGKQLQLFEGFRMGGNTLTFEYQAKPKQTMYFIGAEVTDNLQIWTQGQGKNTSHWFPSFDDANEKVIFNLTIDFDSKYQVVANGTLQNKINQSGKTTWDYKMEHPMSSYLLMLAIGQYEERQLISKSGVPLNLYIENAEASKFEPTYRYSQSLFDYLEKEIGVPYPWQVYKQVPVRDFLYAGMENTSATVFSSDFVVDSIGFNDKNYVNVNAHELAHQWFGDLVTAESGKHHWLQEGFATYYALLAEKEVFGEDYFYHKLYTISRQLIEASKTDTVPILNEKASSLSFYQKGAWALHVLREAIGPAKFKKATKKYLQKHAFQNVKTQDFLDEISKVAKYDVQQFSKIWLEQPGFDPVVSKELLLKNKAMKTLFEVQDLKKETLSYKKQFFENQMQSEVYYSVKEAIVYQLESVPFDEKESILKLAMQTNQVKVRQAVAKTVKEVPLVFKTEYESLLNDPSYITREIVLSKLWSQFPEDRIQYLNQSKEWIGFNDKNLRILWLTLALGTKDYEVENKVKWYDELLGYCSPKQESFVRQNAIENVLFMNENDQNVLPYLVNATTSHRWQFSKFGRDNIRVLLKKKAFRTYFENLLPTLSEPEKGQLQRLLLEK